MWNFFDSGMDKALCFTCLFLLFKRKRHVYPIMIKNSETLLLTRADGYQDGYISENVFIYIIYLRMLYLYI